MVGATSGYAAVKQYMLTDASYPIFVNGAEYVDAERPILNYEGSTYVPLAKLGDITGVNYKWNEKLKRVEIEAPGVIVKQKVYSDYTKDVPNFAYVVGIPDGKRLENTSSNSVSYKYDVSDALESNLDKYIAALENAGFVYEDYTSTEEILYYVKGKTVVGLYYGGYDFYVLLTTD